MTRPAPSPQPYWWDAAPLTALPGAELPRTADIAIVGAGYAGLSAAITLARAGRAVVVLDRQHPGEGASTRNGGITSGNIRPGPAELVRRFGEARALAIEAEGKAAREDLYRFIAEEGIDCDFALTGRFSGAIDAGDYEAGARLAERLTRRLGIEAHAVPRAEQHRHIGTDFYRGGNVRMDIGGLHPAKLHAGMLRLARDAGVAIHSGTAVTAMRSSEGHHELVTDRGTLTAREVVVATNGYTDRADPWLRRRLVPLRSRIIATEPLPPATMERLFPTRMMLSDSRQLSFYYRPSPDFSRILFGGRDRGTDLTDAAATEELRQGIVELFPELSEVGLTHSWYGLVAMNRDMVPRIFTRDHRVYATGFCGSGVVWARWAGQQVARQMLGATGAAGADGASAFDFRPPRFVPLIDGKPWFMPLLFALWTRQDRVKLARRDAAEG